MIERQALGRSREAGVRRSLCQTWLSSHACVEDWAYQCGCVCGYGEDVIDKKWGLFPMGKEYTVASSKKDVTHER